MPARLKPELSVVGDNLVFQVAVGYDSSIPVGDLLAVPVVINAIDEASGGPGAANAYPVRISDTVFQWSAVAGYFIIDENTDKLVDENNNLLIGQ